MRPNILFVLIDAGRFDRFGFHGYQTATTPRLDAFAEQATIFENAYATAPWTLPSVAAMFTGLFPFEHGLHFGRRDLPSGVLTLPQVLSRHGYVSLGASSNPWVGPGSSLNSGFDQFTLVDRLFNDMPPKRWQAYVERAYRLIRRPVDSGGRRTTELALAQLEQVGREQPFFMFLHYLEPHAPYRPQWEWARPFFDSRQEFDEALRLGNVELSYLARQRDLSARELGLISKLYDSLLFYVDDQVGRVLTAVESQGLMDNTLVIVVADHGENLGEHGLLGHQYCLYDSLLHIPMLVRFPGQQRGMRRKELVTNLDIFATALGRLGYDRRDFPYLSRWVDLANFESAPDYIYANYTRPMIERFQRHYPGFDYSPYDHELWAVRSDSYKLIGRDDGQVELYDYAKDPEELHDLAASQPDVVEQLRAEHERANANSAVQATETDLELDDLTLSRLRELGYVE